MQTLLRTPLYERHVALGARMVPFAGWEMPVQYEGVIPEHRAVREDCGVFDVSHMGRFEFEGPKVPAALQALLSNDIDKVDEGGAQYTLLTNEPGGIIDDLIVYRVESGRFVLVVNASNREADFEWITGAAAQAPTCVTSPTSSRCSPCRGRARWSASDWTRLRPSPWRWARSAGIEVMVNRTGYTGEKGVELMVMAEDAVRALGRRSSSAGPGRAGSERATPCGSRSATRCTATTSGPDTDAISAGLGWVCALDTEFTGVEELRRIKEEGPAQQARGVRHAGPRHPEAGHGHRGRRRGDLRLALADARSRHRDGLRRPRSTLSPGRR